MAERSRWWTERAGRVESCCRVTAGDEVRSHRCALWLQQSRGCVQSRQNKGFLNKRRRAEHPVVLHIVYFLCDSCRLSSPKAWKLVLTFLRDFLHIIMIESHSGCRFVNCTSTLWIFLFPTSKGVRLRYADWIRRHAWDDLSFVTWCTIRQEVSIRIWYTVLIKAWSWSATTLR